MKKKSNTRVFSLLAAISAFVAIMCMFADIFSEKVGSGEGNIFVAMFGMHNTDQYVVWPLVIGFCALAVLVIVGFIGFALGDAGKKFIPFIEIILGLGVGVSFFFAINFFVSCNSHIYPSIEAFMKSHLEATLGAGSICVIVFSFFSAALGLLNVIVDSKDK